MQALKKKNTEIRRYIRGVYSLHIKNLYMVLYLPFSFSVVPNVKLNPR